MRRESPIPDRSGLYFLSGAGFPERCGLHVWREPPIPVRSGLFLCPVPPVPEGSGLYVRPDATIAVASGLYFLPEVGFPVASGLYLLPGAAFPVRSGVYFSRSTAFPESSGWSWERSRQLFFVIFRCWIRSLGFASGRRPGRRVGAAKRCREDIAARFCGSYRILPTGSAAPALLFGAGKKSGLKRSGDFRKLAA